MTLFLDLGLQFINKAASEPEQTMISTDDQQLIADFIARQQGGEDD